MHHTDGSTRPLLGLLLFSYTAGSTAFRGSQLDNRSAKKQKTQVAAGLAS